MDPSFAQPAERSRPPTAAKALLSQCKAMACNKLSGIIAEALGKVENDLFALASESADLTEQQVLLEAMAQVRAHREEILKTFDRCFAELYEQRTHAPGTPLTASQEVDLNSLSLVDDSTMEEDLAINELARKTKNRLDPDQALGIQARFGHLLARESLDDEGNPLSPDTVFKALKQACAKIPGDFAVKHSLLAAVQPYVATGIDTVYADVNKNLISHHVLPRIKHHVQRAADRLGTSQPMGLSQMLATSQAMHTSQMMNLSQLMHPAGAGMSASAPLNPAMSMSMPLDLSALLAGVMSGPPAARQQAARMFADPGSYHLDNVMNTPATPALLSTLSNLQANMAVTGAHAIPIDWLASLDQQVRSQSHPLDQLTIELVTMVFDYILNDQDVPDTVKAEIARLQIIAVKAALLDRTFFARRQHPMRRLMDRIASAAQDPEIDTHAESEFLIGLRAITNETINTFDDDLAVFEAAYERLESLIGTSTQAQRRVVETTKITLAREEQTQLAETEARAEMRRHLTRQTPGFVREFLYKWWTPVLAQARINDDQGEAQWTETIEIAQALIWSVSPLKSADVQRLAGMLPQLMRGLLYGMNAIAMPADTREVFFNQLMETHTAAVSHAKALSRSGEMPVLDAEALAVPTAADTDESDDPETEAVDATHSGFDVGDLLLHTVKSLERGAIVEFIEDGDTPIRCKLSWVSPKQTMLLFTSTAGARKYSPDALATALQQGKARLVEEMEALVDRAFGAIVAEQSAAA
ncbi:MAG TPA: DUF1631 family protein [Burkholderiales bacterium]